MKVVILVCLSVIYSGAGGDGRSGRSAPAPGAPPPTVTVAHPWTEPCTINQVLATVAIN